MPTTISIDGAIGYGKQLFGQSRPDLLKDKPELDGFAILEILAAIRAEMKIEDLLRTSHLPKTNLDRVLRTHILQLTVDDSGAHPGRACFASVRPLLPEDMPVIYSIVLRDELSWQWHYNTGAVPTYSAFVATFIGNAHFYLVITTNQTGTTIGVTALHGTTMRHRTGYLARALTSTASPAALIEGVVLSTEYAFASLNLQKLYLAVPAYQMPLYRAGECSYFVSEGRLSNHLYLDYQRWDLTILAIYREQHSSFFHRWMRIPTHTPSCIS
ncbi:MAG TPA: hypothetical protein VHB02_15315 [Acidimicrobiales bacterium]|nr:hypothetical protein [Acidimicrobiales bacterium]